MRQWQSCGKPDAGLNVGLFYNSCMGKIWVAVVFTAFWVGSVAQNISAGKANSAPAAEPERGTVCVLPNASEPPTRVSPGGMYNPATLTIGIDKRLPSPWPHKQTVKIDDLSLDERHLIVLRSDKKRIQSFWFRFSDSRYRKLCVSFDGYQGVQFGDSHTTFWCKCK